MKYEIGGTGDADGLRRLLDRPNPDDNLQTFYDYVTTGMRRYGVGMAWIVPDADGKPLELWPLQPSWCTPLAALPGYPDGAYLVTTPQMGGSTTIDAGWIFRAACPDPVATDVEVADRVSAALTRHVARRFGENLTVTVLPS